MRKKLSKDFYLRDDVLAIARDLLGKVLVAGRWSKSNNLSYLKFLMLVEESAQNNFLTGGCIGGPVFIFREPLSCCRARCPRAGSGRTHDHLVGDGSFADAGGCTVAIGFISLIKDQYDQGYGCFVWQ